jgi:tetratricopeptide (TPR) repeat protein
VERVESLGEAAPDLSVYLSSVGSFALAYARAGRPVEAAALLDRASTIGLETWMRDAEWLPNMTSVARAAVLLRHPVLPQALAVLEPYAGLVAFEGIGAGLYGSVARFVAQGYSVLGRHDEAVGLAEQALVVNRRFGGTLVADALRTLADCLAAAGDPTGRATSLHDEADAAYAAVGARHLVRAVRPPVEPASQAMPNELRREGDVWRISYRGTSTMAKHSKGLADLAILLDRPGREVHVTELEGLPAEIVGGRGDDALDRRAIAAYKDRLTELAEALDEADAAHDMGRAEMLRAEYDMLVDQLSSAVGLGGRRRPAGPDPVERLRKAVSARLRDAIRRIEPSDAALGRHLINAIRTGMYCSYQPEEPTTWRCQARPSLETH